MIAYGGVCFRWRTGESNSGINRLKPFKNAQVVMWAAEPVSLAFYRFEPSVLCFFYSHQSKSLVSSFSIPQTVPS